MKDGTEELLKFKRLCRRLRRRPYAVEGLLNRLWRFARRNAPDGDLTRFSAVDLAEELTWEGDADALLDALTSDECRWLDKTADGRLLVHDWYAHCEHSVHRTLARQRRRFATGEAPNLTKLDYRERVEVESFYASGSTQIAGRSAASGSPGTTDRAASGSPGLPAGSPSAAENSPRARARPGLAEPSLSPGHIDSATNSPDQAVVTGTGLLAELGTGTGRTPRQRRGKAPPGPSGAKQAPDTGPDAPRAVYAAPGIGGSDDKSGDAGRALPTGTARGRALMARVDADLLRSTDALIRWWADAASGPSPICGSGEQSRLRVVAAAVRALREADNPVAFFVAMIRDRAWARITDADEDGARARLREYDRANGPLMATELRRRILDGMTPCGGSTDDGA